MQWGSTVFYEKTPESPNEQWSHDASRIQRRYIIAGDAASRFQAAKDFLGYSQLFSATINGTKQWFVSRNLPHAISYGNQKGDVFLYAQAIVQTENLGRSSLDFQYPDLTAHTKALITVEYRTLTYDVRPDPAVRAGGGTLQGYPDEGWAMANGNGGASVLTAAGNRAGDLATPWLTPGRYVTRLFQPGGQFLTLRNGMMFYVDGSPTGPHIPVPEGIPYKVPWISATYVWHQVPVSGFPARAIQLAQGTVNASNFDGWPAQTMLLLDGPAPRPYRDAFGNRILDIEYRFKIQANTSRDGTNTPRGHNWILRTNGGSLDYWQMSSDGTANGTPPYAATDFSLLFKPDQN